jgi:hypothetical protein
MSKQIINDYMAGQIGDKYYEFAGEKPEYIGLVTGMDKITDIMQVRAGDIEVTKSGNRYKVVNTDDGRVPDGSRLEGLVPEAEYSVWLLDSAFAYALRPKPEVPTDPGLYLDNRKNVWMLGSTPLRVSHRLIRFQGNFCVDSEVKSGGLEPSLAPYTRIDLEADHE